MSAPGSRGIADCSPTPISTASAPRIGPPAMPSGRRPDHALDRSGEPRRGHLRVCHHRAVPGTPMSSGERSSPSTSIPRHGVRGVGGEPMARARMEWAGAP